MDRALCVLAACLTVTAALAGCAASGAPFEPIANAGWKPGYTFGYTAQADAEGSSRFEVGDSVEEQSLDDKLDFAERPFLAYRVLDTPTVDGIPVYLTLTQERHVLAFRQADLQPMETSYAVTNNAPAVVTVSDRGLDHSWLRFPLTRGDTWRSTLRSDIPGVGNPFEATIVAEVKGMESVDGPNGPVDAVRVEHEIRFDSDAIESAMRREAAKEGVEIHSLSLDFSGSHTIHYAPSLHNVVRAVDDVRVRFDARFTAEGQDAEGHFDLHLVNTVRLASVSLEEAPATPLSALKSVRAPSLPAVQAADGRPGVSLRLQASAERVNAADQPVVVFTATGEGFTRYSLELMDAEGTVVERDNSPTAQWTFDQPGLYTAVATGYTEDGATLTDSVEVAADYDATFEDECSFLSTLFACGSEMVPVRAGITGLVVSAVRHPLAGESGMGTLRLMSDRDSWDADMSGNEATIEVADAQADGSDWQLWYEPTLGVADDVDYHVQLTYGGAPYAAGVAQGMGAASLTHAAETLAGSWARPLLPG